MTENYVRMKPIPKGKENLVKDTASKINSSKTVLIASCKSLPSSQFQAIKKKLRGKADIKFMKKTALGRAIDDTGKGALQQLKKGLGADFAVFFSDLDAFELSGLLSESQVPTKAKAGDIAPENIEIEPGPTDLIPGPAISELSGVGLKVAVKEGKLEIMQGATVAKKGDEIKPNVAGVLGKLNILPMKVGFIPLMAYDAKSDSVYFDIKIDREGTLLELKSLIGKALGFAVKINYPVKETIVYFISKAAMEEKALSSFVESKAGNESSEIKTEVAKKEEEDKVSEDQIQEDTKEETA